MRLKKIQLYVVQNGLILRNIMKTAQDSYTITIKQIVMFQERMHFDKFKLYQIQNGRLSAIIHFASLILGKQCQIAKPLL